MTIDLIPMGSVWNLSGETLQYFTYSYQMYYFLKILIFFIYLVYLIVLIARVVANTRIYT